MGRAYLFVEGHGDTQAALNLVIRLWQNLALSPINWASPCRGKNMHQERGVEKACSFVRSRGDCEALLILRDEDDQCPRDLAPSSAGWLRKQNLSFPSALVLAHREFEAFFLPCISLIAGHKLRDSNGIERDGILANTRFEGNPEDIRGVKEWLSSHMPRGRSYKPTLDQLPLTRLIDFDAIRSHNPPLPCFGTLERSLKFLDAERQKGGTCVYPNSCQPSR
jgi:hypothetical protein